MRFENGFVIGRDWHSKKITYIPITAIERIVEDCGNQPAANRVYFLDARGSVDLYMNDPQT
jgi:hypothetical protein